MNGCGGNKMGREIRLVQLLHPSKKKKTVCTRFYRLWYKNPREYVHYRTQIG